MMFTKLSLNKEMDGVGNRRQGCFWNYDSVK